MANNSLSGKQGSVSGWGGSSEVTQWSANIVSDILDVTSMASAGWREKILGLQGVTGSITAYGNSSPVVPTATALSLSLVTDGSSTVTVAGDAFLSNIQIQSDVGGVVTYTADFEGTAQWTIT